MVILIALALLAIRGSETVWIEGESPVKANVKPGLGFPGRPELLSAGHWLTITGEVPEDGAKLSYAFNATAGKREVWHRLGYETARSAFEWRIDGGTWRRVDPTEPTTDLTELAEWNGVAWLDMGTVNLSDGGHTLEIHIPRPTKGDVLYGSDVFAVVDGPFHPYGKWKPGEEPRTNRDRAASARTFSVADRTGPERQIVKLDGDWEVARDDEIAPALVATPMTVLDPNPVWTAIAVPGDKAQVRPDLTLAHRVWYRTRFTVPEGQVGRSFTLTFRQNSLNTTVLVNGKPCGFNKNPFVKWSSDVTPAVHGGVNEVMVGIRDAWYGFHQDTKLPASIRSNFAIPLSRERQGFSRLDYPVWGCFKSGLLVAPELVIAGRAHATDVFVRPSVAHKRLDADVIVRGEGPATVSVEAIELDSGKISKTLASANVTLSGEQTVSLGGTWADPILWWPDHPKMYALRTTVWQNGKPTDVGNTPFGFREWTTDGPKYMLNGVVWHGWAELTQGSKPNEWLTNYRKSGQRFQRMSGPAQNGGSVFWLGMPYDEALDWCDENGVIIRRCGPLDGEAIGYMAIDDAGGINHVLLQNVRDQIVAEVRGERNHPSVNVWSVENEWLYINCINLYGGLMDDFETDMAKTIAAVHEVDPTRLAMTDGGGAGKNNILPIHGDHYVYTNDPNDYPSLAYTDQIHGGGRGRWTWDGRRPRYAGEDFFASGINPADYAWIQGESAFESKVAAQRGMAQVQRMITEGYRWGGAFTAFHLWLGDEGAEFHDKFIANAERAVFVRQWDEAFTSGQKAKRTLGVFNDSRFADPLKVDWALVAGGKTLSKGTKTLSVPPGTKSVFDISLAMPIVATRAIVTLTFNLRAGNKLVFHDSKPMAVLPEPKWGQVSDKGSPDKHMSSRRATDTKSLPGLAVYDPSGMVPRYLASHNVHFRSVSSLTRLPDDATTLLVGPDALADGESTDPKLAAYAYDGHRVVVLEQKYPLRGAALPTELEPANGGGAFAFIEDASHPIVRGLADLDLRAWGPAERTYERAYRKATRGIHSFVQVGSRLSQTALCEVPVGRGTMVLCQLQVGHNLSTGGPARNLLANLLTYAATYKRTEKPVRTAVSEPELAKALEATGVRRLEVADPLAAIQPGGIAVITATPTNLHRLAANLSKVRAFTASGGSLVLNGLTPEGLADYDKIIGVEHMIRPFRREKTALAIPRDPLAAGITQGDVVLSSGEKMFGFNDDTFVADDTFRYVVDVDDVAPFAVLPNEYLYNSVNGFVSADSWKYILSFELKSGAPEYTMTFPKALPFREMTWIGNGFYHKVTKCGLSFDGGPMVTFDVQPNTEPQVLALSPVRIGKKVKLTILEWTKDSGMNDVVGIDNIYMKIARPADWRTRVRPLLNVGGLVRYPQSTGSIVLVNLLFKEREIVPDNALKKRAVLAAILRNLGAGFSGGSNVVVAGARGLNYIPLGLAGKANVFRNEIGLGAVPAGRQIFGSVPFEVYAFPTSPVPNAVALGTVERVEGISVNAKLNALFFLHTSRLDRPLDDRERREGKRAEIARYSVTYADGLVIKVPVYAGIDVDDYRQKAPRDLSNARVVWSKPSTSGGDPATLYLMQWTNPRPDVSILSLGMEYGEERRGSTFLIAVTAAR